MIRQFAARTYNVEIEVLRPVFFQDTDWFRHFANAYDVELQIGLIFLREKGCPTDPGAWDGFVACVTANALSRSRRNGAEKKIPVVIQPELINRTAQ